MTTIDDIADAIKRSEWAAIIECTGCGHTGLMESTHEPRDETVHRTLMKSNEWRDVTE